MDSVYGDARKLREQQETWEATKFKLETQARNQENEIQRLNLLVGNFESEKEVTEYSNGKIQILNQIIFDGYKSCS